MAIGKSGRIVIDLDAELKEELHQEIRKQGMNLKEWFEMKIEQDFPKVYSKHKKKK